MRTLRYLIEFIIIHFLFIIFKFIGYEKASNLGYKIGSTFGNYFTPMIPKLKTEIQDHKHIIPEDSKGDWVRGGLPTRQMVRNSDYLRRCQEKTFQ